MSEKNILQILFILIAILTYAVLAYNEIKDRKGKMVNGVFVKEQDLKGRLD